VQRETAFNVSAIKDTVLRSIKLNQQAYNNRDADVLREVYLEPMLSQVAHDLSGDFESFPAPARHHLRGPRRLLHGLPANRQGRALRLRPGGEPAERQRNDQRRVDLPAGSGCGKRRRPRPANDPSLPRLLPLHPGRHRRTLVDHRRPVRQRNLAPL